MEINRQIRHVTAGDNNSFAQAFFNNYFADSRPVKTPFVQFNKPLYFTYGGTLNYYSSDPYAIFTNLASPSIAFSFSSHTESLSGDSYFSHEIYRLNYDVYSTNDFNTIQEALKTPLVVLTATTSGFTGSEYTLFLDQYVKQEGSYKTELFLDKSQYFINTKIIFNVNLNKKYADFFSNTKENGVVPSTWDNTLKITTTNSPEQAIESGPFTNMRVAGNYFTYFIVPDKPKFEYPIMSGALTTYSPDFVWANGEKADSFVIQINYNTADSGFTGTVVNYPVVKTAEMTRLARSTTKGPNDEFLSEKPIYRHQVPVKSGSDFLFRVGNVKEIRDVFDSKRNVIAFSDYYSATSQSQEIRNSVTSESDIRAGITIPGPVIPPSLDTEYVVASFELAGKVSGTTTVTGATLQLTYPDSSFVTTVTDLSGKYSFGTINNGNYSLQTSYRGYKDDVRLITINNNVVENIQLEIVWGSTYHTWNDIGNNLFS